MKPVSPVSSPVNAGVESKNEPIKKRFSLTDRIAQLSRQIFNFICFWRKPPNPLSQRTIQIIEAVKREPLGSAKIKKFDTSISELEALGKKQTLDEVAATNMELASILTECAYEQYIQEPVLVFQAFLETLPEKLNTVLKSLIAIGDTTFKPLLEKLSAIKQSDRINDELKNLLNFLKSEDYKNDVKSGALREKFIVDVSKRTEKPPEPYYLIGVLDWLHTNQEITLIQFLDKRGIRAEDPRTIDFAFEAAITFLIQEKLALFADKAKVLKDNLPNIVKDLISINQKKLSSVISRRITTLLSNIDNTDYTRSFDTMVSKVSQHADALATATSEAKESIRRHRSMIDLTQKKLQLESKTEQERLDQKDRKEALEKINTPQKIKEQKKRFFFESFSNQPACHHLLRDLIENIESSPDFEITRMEKEENEFQAMTDRIFDLIFPVEKLTIDGKEQSKDHFELVFGELELPPLLQDVVDQAIIIDAKILSLKPVENAADLSWLVVKEYIKGVASKELVNKIKQRCVDSIKSVIKNFMAKGIQIAFEKVTNHDQVDELVSQTVFPITQQKMLAGFGRQVISANLGKLVPHFLKLLNANPNDPERFANLYNKIFGLTKKQCSQFPLQKEVFIPAIRELLEKLERVLLAVKEDFKASKQEMTPAKATAIIEQYFKDTDSANAIPSNQDLLYSKLIESIVLKVGKLSSFVNWVFGFKKVKNLTNQAVLPLVHEARKSPDFILKTILESIRGNFLQKDRMLKLMQPTQTMDQLEAEISKAINKIKSLNEDQKKLGGEKLINNKLAIEQLREKVKELESKQEKIVLEDREAFRAAKKTKKNLSIQIQEIAQLSYDMLMFNAKASSKLGSFFAKRITGPDSTYINKVITRCYEKLLGERLLTDNLLFQIKLVVLEMFQTAAKKASIQG